MSTQEHAAPKRRSSRGATKNRQRNARSRSPQQNVATATPEQAAVTAPPSTSTSREATEATNPARETSRRRSPAAETKTAGRRFIATERTEGLRRFTRETIAEIKKVNWPDQETTRNLTLVVIAVSVVLGILLGGIDYVLFQIFEALS